MAKIVNVVGSYRQTWTTGAVTGVAAGSASAGHLLALRVEHATRAVRIRSFEAEFLLTTAFGAAQEVGFDAYLTSAYSAAHSGQTALTTTGGKIHSTQENSLIAGSISNTGALTNGTHTIDTNAIARGSVYCSAIGASLAPRLYDFTSCEAGGLILTGPAAATAQGLIIRNTIAMGATGVGKWHFTFEWDDVVIGG